MNLATNREKLLILLLPAALILCGYSLKLSSLRTRHAGAQAALEETRKTTPQKAQFQAERKRIADLNAELAELANRNKDREAQWRKLQQDRSTNSTVRIEAIEEITALLNRNQLKLVDEEPAEGTDAGKLPASLEAVAALLKKNNPEVNTDLWRVRCVGRYEDVLHALEELNEVEPLAIPVHLQMGEAKHTTEIRSWTLFLWI
jgi:chromosome segregation ATPase